jgi:hypothetical protein
MRPARVRAPEQNARHLQTRLIYPQEVKYDTFGKKGMIVRHQTKIRVIFQKNPARLRDSPAIGPNFNGCRST